MSDKTKFPAEQALQVAEEIETALSPHCERWQVAGSLRRGKSEVGDVEILFIPRTGLGYRSGEMIRSECNFAEQAIEDLLRFGILRKRPNSEGAFAWGEKNKLAIHCESGIPVDLFTASEANWFNYLVCRTGPAASNIAICEAALARGWKWNPYGAGFTRRGIMAEEELEEYAVHSEEDVFRFVGLPYLKPKER